MVSPKVDERTIDGCMFFLVCAAAAYARGFLIFESVNSLRLCMCAYIHLVCAGEIETVSIPSSYIALPASSLSFTSSFSITFIIPLAEAVVDTGAAISLVSLFSYGYIFFIIRNEVTRDGQKVIAGAFLFEMWQHCYDCHIWDMFMRITGLSMLCMSFNRLLFIS